MSTQTADSRSASPFGHSAVLAILLIGFGAFLALLYFLGAGDTGGESRNRTGHAASNALHGFAGLSALLEANGYEVEKSRDLSGLDTSDLLVLTPPLFADPEELARILENRQYLGPTLLIMPKWSAFRPAGEIAASDEDRVQDDWVQLIAAGIPSWAEQLPEPYALELSQESPSNAGRNSWGGLNLSGELPRSERLSASASPGQEPLVIGPSGQVLAMEVIGQPGTFFYDNANSLTIVVEPDLMNNYGLADPARAALALELVERAGYDDGRVTFDMTLVGIGGTTNLLTLAFRPPFVAGTLCLILAMLVVGWRAFLRFGPVTAPEQTTSFGKAQLVRNGARLIVQSGRMRLLAAPYAALAERRLTRSLGLPKPDKEAIDQALIRRMPDEEPFSFRAARLHNANRSSDVLKAAQGLNDLTQKTTGNSKR